MYKILRDQPIINSTSNKFVDSIVMGESPLSEICLNVFGSTMNQCRERANKILFLLNNDNDIVKRFERIKP